MISKNTGDCRPSHGAVQGNNKAQPAMLTTCCLQDGAIELLCPPKASQGCMGACIFPQQLRVVCICSALGSRCCLLWSALVWHSSILMASCSCYWRPNDFNSFKRSFTTNYCLLYITFIMTAVNSILLSTLPQTIWVWTPLQEKPSDNETPLQCLPRTHSIPPSHKTNQCKSLSKLNWCALIPLPLMWNIHIPVILCCYLQPSLFFHK